MGKKGYLFVASIGTTLGSYVPVLFGAAPFGFASIFFGMVGGIGAIYLAFKLFGS